MWNEAQYIAHNGVHALIHANHKPRAVARHKSRALDFYKVICVNWSPILRAFWFLCKCRIRVEKQDSGNADLGGSMEP